VVQVPVVGQPGAERQGPGALEQALGAIPQGLQQLGAAGVQRETLQLHQEELQLVRQKAFDTLNGKTAGVQVRVPLQTLDGTLRQQDWQTAPEQLYEQGQKLIQDQGKTLTPQARAIYEHDAQSYLSVLHGRATDARGQRMEQMSAFTLAQQLTQAQHDFANATSDYERQVALGQVTLSVQQLVAAGAIAGTAGATALKQLGDTMEVQTVKTAIYAYPDRMDVQLRNQAKIAMGDTTVQLDPSLPKAPVEHLADLGKEATAVQAQRLAQQEHVERRSDEQWKKTQDGNLRDLQARIAILVPTPENVAQYDRLIAEVNAKSQGDHPQFDATAQRMLTNELQRLKHAALTPPPARDHEATYDQIVIRLNAVQNERDYQNLRQYIVNNKGMLKNETFKTFMDELYSRMRQDHYAQSAGFKDGVRAITQAEVTEGALIPQFSGPQKEVRDRHMRDALDNFNAAYEALYRENQPQANAQGRTLGLQMRRDFLDDPYKELQSKNLARPLLMPGPGGTGMVIIPREQEPLVRHNIDRLQIPDAEKQRLYQQWLDTHNLRGQPKSTGTPTGTTPAAPPAVAPTRRREAQ
jgi:hypothetical protein